MTEVRFDKINTCGSETEEIIIEEWLKKKFRFSEYDAEQIIKKYQRHGVDYWFKIGDGRKLGITYISTPESGPQWTYWEICDS